MVSEEKVRTVIEELEIETEYKSNEHDAEMLRSAAGLILTLYREVNYWKGHSEGFRSAFRHKGGEES